MTVNSMHWWFYILQYEPYQIDVTKLPKNACHNTNRDEIWRKVKLKHHNKQTHDLNVQNSKLYEWNLARAITVHHPVFNYLLHFVPYNTHFYHNRNVKRLLESFTTWSNFSEIQCCQQNIPRGVNHMTNARHTGPWATLKIIHRVWKRLQWCETMSKSVHGARNGVQKSLLKQYVNLYPFHVFRFSWNYIKYVQMKRKRSHSFDPMGTFTYHGHAVSSEKINHQL